MPVNGVPWSLLDKVSEVPWVPECLKYRSASSTQVSWVAEVPSAYRIFIKFLHSVQMQQNFGSLFFRINKFVRNAALTGWFSCQNCLKNTVHKLIILTYFYLKKQYTSGRVGRVERKGSVWYCLKRHIKSIFCKTQKWVFWRKIAHFSLILLQ